MCCVTRQRTDKDDTSYEVCKIRQLNHIDSVPTFSLGGRDARAMLGSTGKLLMVHAVLGGACELGSRCKPLVFHGFLGGLLNVPSESNHLQPFNQHPRDVHLSFQRLTEYEPTQ